jgi:hypothetical protein
VWGLGWRQRQGPIAAVSLSPLSIPEGRANEYR